MTCVFRFTEPKPRCHAPAACCVLPCSVSGLKYSWIHEWRVQPRLDRLSRMRGDALFGRGYDGVRRSNGRLMHPHCLCSLRSLFLVRQLILGLASLSLPIHAMATHYADHHLLGPLPWQAPFSTWRRRGQTHSPPHTLWQSRRLWQRHQRWTPSLLRPPHHQRLRRLQSWSPLQHPRRRQFQPHGQWESHRRRHWW